MDGRADQLRRLLPLYRAGRIDENELIERVSSSARDSEPADTVLRDVQDPVEGERRDLAAALDAYRVAEESGAATLAAWARQTANLELQGGLRVAAAREVQHAEVLARRVRELGAELVAELPDWLEAYNRSLLDERASDDDRLHAVVERFPDVEAAMAPLRERIDSIRYDPLTRELLREIAFDDELTLRWMHAAWSRRTARR